MAEQAQLNGVSDLGRKWSEPYLLTSGHHLAVGDRPGVYRVRAFDGEGRPLPISRADGVDAEGILHIGQSMRLGTRVREFRQAAEGRNAQHGAGRQFHQWGFGRKFPLSRLRFDYLLVRDKREAMAVERQLRARVFLTIPDQKPDERWRDRTGNICSFYGGSG